MKEIAIYGKGGIGKSTLTANISAALAEAGERVLQIGCDPKHDSTRLLMRGKRITTVLDYIRDTAVLDQKRSDILFDGYLGIGCIEAGGPKPGVGCAGRGIITAFELLDKFHIKEDYSAVMYDVLGDVVCGGFAVPIRREYADEIFVVTSGEYMSIYAANNILRGIANYDTDAPRVAGILYNSRNVKGERERVEKFAGAVGLPVFAEIPRSDVFAECERRNVTLIEASAGDASCDESVAVGGAGLDKPDESGGAGRDNAAASDAGLDNVSGIAGIFRDIANRIKGGVPHFAASPLTDEELERLIMGTEFLSEASPTGQETQAQDTDQEDVSSDAPVQDADQADCMGDDTVQHANVIPVQSENQADGGEDVPLSKNVIRDEPLHGCAFNGAVGMSIHVRDAVVLMHAPKSCAYLSYQTITSTGRRSLYERGAVLPSALLPGLDSTFMTESDMVFGGTDKLIEKVREITGATGDQTANGGSPQKKLPRAVIIVSSCPSGIIGDDIDKAKAFATPDCPVYTVKADGNLAGDYLQGMLMAYTSLAKQIIAPNQKPGQTQERMVNINQKPGQTQEHMVNINQRPGQSPERTVNIVFEKVVLKNAEINFQIIRGFLSRMGIGVNCRFLYNTSFDSIKNFLSADLNLLAYRDYTGNILKEFFEKTYGAKFFDRQFPVGFTETCEWLRGVGEYFDRLDSAEEMIREHEEEYKRRIDALRPALSGKKLFIITFNHDIDWFLGAALDCGIKVVKIGVLNFSQDEGFRTRIPEVKDIDVVEDYDRDDRLKDIEQLEPDIVLGNYGSDDLADDIIVDTIPMAPDVGFFSGLEVVERWSTLVSSGQDGEWVNDRKFFEKYYK